MSLPRQLAYPTTKSSAVASSSTCFSLSPTSQATGFQPGQTISFDIPCGQRATYLDPSGTYLRFTVTPNITSADTEYWQAHAFDFVKQLQLYGQQGSTQVESIDQYAALHSALRDLCSDVSNGTSDSIMLNSDPTTVRGAAALPKATPFTFCMPLVSIIGTLTGDSAYLPIHALSAPLRLDLTLNSAADALALNKYVSTTISDSVATGVSYTVSAPTLNLTYVTISDLAQSQIHAMCGGKYQINSTMWRMYRTVHSATQASNSIQIPARFDSVRSVLTIMRDASVLDDFKFSSNSDRIKNGLKTYQHRIGSAFANGKPVDCTTAAWPFIELRRLFSNVSSESMPTLLTAAEFLKDAKTPSAVLKKNVGSFMFGLEAQPFSQVDKLISGTSTLANAIWIDLNFETSCIAAVVDSAVEVDILVTSDGAESGQLTIAY